MKKYSLFLILFSLAFIFSPQKVKAIEGYELGVYYAYNYNLMAQYEDKYKNFDFKQGQSGFNLQLKSPHYVGFGISIFQKNFKDLAENREYKINNYFFDLSYKIPVPDYLNVTVGAGIGQADLECGNKICTDFYKDFPASKENISQIFVNLGFKIGYIYKLNVGFHRVNGGSVKFISKTGKEAFKIEGDANVYTVGISISFV